MNLKVLILSLFHLPVTFLTFIYSDIGTLNFSYPGNIHAVSNITTTGQVVKATLTWSNSDFNLTLTLARNGVRVSNTTAASPLSLNFTTTSTTLGFYTYKVSKSGPKPIAYKIDLYLSGVLIRTDNYLGVSNNTLKTIYLYNITTGCPRVEFSSPQRTYFSNFYAYSPSVIPSLTSIQLNYTYFIPADKETFILNLTQTGIWYLIPQDAISAIPGTTYNVQNNITISLKCVLCGDLIRQQGEECDNGNISGCINCKVGPEYVCVGDIGSTSNCTCNVPSYFLNQTSSQCIIDCSLITNAVGNIIGQTNTCQCMQPLVYNSVTQSCDVDCNYIPYAIQIGSISQCLCIKAYQWLADKYLCNPICGDGIKKIEEQCQDGNLIDGDGCDSNCQIQVIKKDYTGLIVGLSIGVTAIVVISLVLYIKLTKKKIKIRKSKNSIIQDDIRQQDRSMQKVQYQ